MDNISTFRGFDKGKMGADGTIRDVHIDTYFDVIDRSPESNDPAKHIHEGVTLSENNDHRLEKLMRSRHYDLDKLIWQIRIYLRSASEPWAMKYNNS